MHGSHFPNIDYTRSSAVIMINNPEKVRPTDQTEREGEGGLADISTRRNSEFPCR